MSVTSLQHVALAVPDPEAGKSFYTDFRLEAQVRGNQIAMRCPGGDRDQVILIEGAKRKLHHICLGTAADQLAGIQEKAEKSGARLVDAPGETPGEGIWFADPDGILINIRVADAATPAGGPNPSSAEAPLKINSPGHFERLGVRAAPERGRACKPLRLGHMLQFTPNFAGKLDFYTDVLGFRLADKVGAGAAWLYCDGGSDHHVMAFAATGATGLHHLSFEFANIDEVGQGAKQLIEKGHRNGWGFGRHVIGSNYFHYVRDPWNSLVEFYCDMDYIPAGADWEVRDWPEEDMLYAWGPDLPDDFLTNFEAVEG